MFNCLTTSVEPVTANRDMPYPPSQVNLGDRTSSQAQVRSEGERNWLLAGYCSSIKRAVTALSRRTTVAKTYSCTHRYSTAIRTSLLRVQRCNSKLWRATGGGKHSPLVSLTMKMRTIL